MGFLAAITFPVLVAWSVALLVFHILLQAHFARNELGTAWNTGPRDSQRRPQGALAGRAERASQNFRETYPAFVGLALALAIVEPMSAGGHTGAVLWFAARLVYIPLYLAGISYARSMVWGVSLIGLFIMFLSLVF